MHYQNEIRRQFCFLQSCINFQKTQNIDTIFVQNLRSSKSWYGRILIIPAPVHSLLHRVSQDEDVRRPSNSYCIFRLYLQLHRSFGLADFYRKFLVHHQPCHMAKNRRNKKQAQYILFKSTKKSNHLDCHHHITILTCRTRLSLKMLTVNGRSGSISRITPSPPLCFPLPPLPLRIENSRSKIGYRRSRISGSVIYIMLKSEEKIIREK